MLTEKQKNNIYNLSFEDLIELDEIIKDSLGTMLKNDFLKIYPYSREQLLKDCKSGKVKAKNIGNKFFPYANVYLNHINN